MKKSIFALILSFQATVFQVVAEENPWLTDYDEAVTQSIATDKPIFLLFTNSHSCGPCILLEKQILSTPDFVEFARTEIIPLKVDFAPIYRNKDIPSSDENLLAFRREQNIPDHLTYRGWPYLVLFRPTQPAIFDDTLREFSDFDALVNGIGLGTGNSA
ncbi:MAG: thioredoxin family protein, partial [Puniceicoccales bacterium]